MSSQEELDREAFQSFLDLNFPIVDQWGHRRLCNLKTPIDLMRSAYLAALARERQANSAALSKQKPVAECFDNGTLEGGIRWIPYLGIPQEIEVGSLFYAAPIGQAKDKAVEDALRQVGTILDEWIDIAAQSGEVREVEAYTMLKEEILALIPKPEKG